MSDTAQFEVFGPFFHQGELVTAPKLYHYIPGTSREKTAWDDYNKALTAAQPIQGDANGLVRGYFDGLYKLEIRTSDGATVLWQADNVQFNASDTAGGVTSLFDYGVTGDGITIETKAIQTALNEARGTLLFPPGTYLSGNLTISSKRNLVITGPGAVINWNGTAAAGSCIGFQLVGTCENVTIRDLTLNGDGIAANAHAGVWGSSGQAHSNIKTIFNKITNVTIGVSYNANLAGTFDGGLIAFNELDTIIGTSPGQGYGIHLDSAKAIRVFKNKINKSQRHAIYHASGNTGSVIHSNISTNHRQGVAASGYSCAISISRSSNVLVSQNIVKDHWDGGLEIAHTTVGALNCTAILAIDNAFINRQNLIEDVLIGEKSVPTSYETTCIKLSQNLFHSSYLQKSTNADILIVNGRQIELTNNTHKTTDVSGTLRFISVGHDTYMTSVDHCTEVHVKDNRMFAEGSSLTDIRAVDYASELCTNTSRHTCLGNLVPVTATRAYFNSTRTNPNLVTDTTSGHRKGIYTAADTTPSVFGITFMRITNAGAITITQFDDGEDGQTIDLSFGDANTTIQDGANIQLAGSANFTSANNKTLRLLKDGSVWQQIGGSTN